MNKIAKRNIKEICSLVDQIIEGPVDKSEYRFIFLDLNEALKKGLSYDDVVLLCEMVIKISKTKNKILRHLEKGFWNFINECSFYIISTGKLKITENEQLSPNTAYAKLNKRILSRWIGLAQEILEIKDDKSKGSDLRRSESLRLIGDLINYYDIPIAKNLFVESINSKNVKEQYAALEGLEHYYSVSDDEIEDDLINDLKRIKEETDERSVASTCLQIMINVGLIDQLTAVFEMDDWKDDHYKFR
jgi:hypothetical protein